MEIVQTVKSSKKSSKRHDSSKSCRCRLRKRLTKEEMLESQQLFRENAELYEKAKRGNVTKEDVKRHHKILERLMELRRI